MKATIGLENVSFTVVNVFVFAYLCYKTSELCQTGVVVKCNITIAVLNTMDS